MRGLSRAASTLIGAGAAGFLLWLAAQFARHTTGGYWASYGVIAAAGLIVGLSQLRGRDGHPRGMLTLAFLPVLIVAGWVLIGMEPNGNWFRNHVLSWSGDIHVRGVVEDVGTWIGVLAFGIGLVFGFTLEPSSLRRRPVVETGQPMPTYDPRVADEPLTAERHTAPAEPAAQPESETRIEQPVGHDAAPRD